MAERTDEINCYDDASQDATAFSTRSGFNIPSDDSENSSDRIRDDIDRTRARMDETVDELESRMSLDYLAKCGLEMVRDGSSAAAKKVGTVIRDNPLPSAVIAAGVLWMIFGKKKSKRRSSSAMADQDVDWSSTEGEYAASTIRRGRKAGSKTAKIKDKAARLAQETGDKVQDLGRGVKQSVHTAGSKVSQTVQNLGSQALHGVEEVGVYARNKAIDLGHQVQYGAERSKEWFVGTVDDYPLAVGAAFFTLGLAGGLAIPATRKENELLGPVRDNLLDHAQSMGSQLLHKGEEAAERVVACAGDAVTAGDEVQDRESQRERERENSM